MSEKKMTDERSDIFLDQYGTMLQAIFLQLDLCDVETEVFVQSCLEDYKAKKAEMIKEIEKETETKSETKNPLMQ